MKTILPNNSVFGNMNGTYHLKRSFSFIHI